ncbi:MAG: SRPBCC family protein [Chloroflexota bacterium]
MPSMKFETVINKPAADIFNLLADFQHYSKWLPSEGLYEEIQQVSDTPIKLGTTYLDNGSTGLLQGSVTEFQPPTRLSFRETATIKRVIKLGTLTIQIRYALEPQGSATLLTREFTLDLGGILRLVQGPAVNAIRKENERILRYLKIYLEAQ